MIIIKNCSMFTDRMYQPVPAVNIPPGVGSFLRGRNSQTPGKRNSCKTMALGAKNRVQKALKPHPWGEGKTQMFDDILIQKDISNIFFKNNVITFFIFNVDLLGNRCNYCERKQVLNS